MKKLRNTRTLTLAAMLTAIGIVLGFLKVPINQFIEIRFGALPLAMAGNILGPGVAAIVGALVDIGGFIVKPTGPYFPGFTISGIVGGIIFGLILYNKKATLPRLLVAHTVYTIIVCVFMNGFWLNMLYLKSGYWAVVVSRLPKQIIMIPIMAIIQYALSQSFAKARLGLMKN